MKVKKNLIIVLMAVIISALSFTNFVCATEQNIEIEMPATEILTTINRQVQITPTVKHTEGSETYQWLKDGVEVEGQNSKTLSITPTSVQNGGAYTLRVTEGEKQTTSAACNIVVRTFEVAITSAKEEVNLQKLEPGTEFEVNFKINNLQNIDKGLVSLLAQLEYNKDILDRIEISGLGQWTLDDDDFNEESLKFIIESGSLIKEEGNILKIKFKVKDTISVAQTTSIKLKGISASGGNGLIKARDAELPIGIVMPPPPSITSEKYIVNNTESDISRIAPNTTVAQFKNNVTANRDLTFLDKDGNPLTETSILGTGMTVKVGNTLQYTLVVTGDINGDKEVNVDDLAKIKLHILDFTKLTGIELKAADLDNDKDISINDVAQVKLKIIGAFEIK